MISPLRLANSFLLNESQGNKVTSNASSLNSTSAIDLIPSGKCSSVLNIRVVLACCIPVLVKMSFTSLHPAGKSFRTCVPNDSISSAFSVANLPASSLSKHRTTVSNDSMNSMFDLKIFSTRLAPASPTHGQDSPKAV